MPLYEFECESCKTRFTVKKLVEDRRTSECPSCGNLAVLVISVVNHTFGWRLTEASHERFAKDEWERAV